MATPSRACPAPAQRQRGVTLIVALVMLVIIGLTSAAVMRGAMSSDLVANNSRLQTLAEQGAQIALRYCEKQVELQLQTPGQAGAIVLVPAPVAGASPAWLQFNNWHGAGAIASWVPSNLVASADSSFAPGQLPQCLAEVSAVGADIYTVTARGFSPGYDEDSNGRALNGSVVWLQSTIRLGS